MNNEEIKLRKRLNIIGSIVGYTLGTLIFALFINISWEAWHGVINFKGISIFFGAKAIGTLFKMAETKDEINKAIEEFIKEEEKKNADKED